MTRFDVVRVSTQGLKQGAEGAFLTLCKKASGALAKAFSSDCKVAVLCGDSDSLGAAIIIFHLIDSHSYSYSQAYGHVKERRITTSIIEMYTFWGLIRV